MQNRNKLEIKLLILKFMKKIHENHLWKNFVHNMRQAACLKDEDLKFQ
jgi:hypothetical protein